LFHCFFTDGRYRAEHPEDQNLSRRGPGIKSWKRLICEGVPKSGPFVFGFSPIGMDKTLDSLEERLLTRRLLADRWSMSVETLKRREKLGILPFMRLERGVRYRLRDIEALEADAEVRS
jgi:hypothetical protein